MLVFVTWYYDVEVDNLEFAYLWLKVAFWDFLLQNIEELRKNMADFETDFDGAENNCLELFNTNLNHFYKTVQQT